LGDVVCALRSACKTTGAGSRQRHRERGRPATVQVHIGEITSPVALHLDLDLLDVGVEESQVEPGATNHLHVRFALDKHEFMLVRPRSGISDCAPFLFAAQVVPEHMISPQPCQVVVVEPHPSHPLVAGVSHRKSAATVEVGSVNTSGWRLQTSQTSGTSSQLIADSVPPTWPDGPWSWGMWLIDRSPLRRPCL
jgi:hypothetical protein